MTVCRFKLFSRNSVTGRLVELDDVLEIGVHDFLVVQLDTEEYPFQLLNNPPKWVWPRREHCFPDLILGVLNLALKLGKIVSTDLSGSITYVLRGETKIDGIGLCPCLASRFDRFVPSDTLQIWTGELLVIGTDGSLRLHRDGWTPGRDHTPPQKSRIWEDS